MSSKPKPKAAAKKPTTRKPPSQRAAATTTSPDTDPATATTESAAIADPAPESADTEPKRPPTPKTAKSADTAAKPKRRTSTKTKASTAKAPVTTLAALAHGYLAHLEDVGKSDTTVFSYRQDLRIALGALGAATDIATLTPDKVQAYFDSDAVTKTKTGRSKAKPTVLKTRRVLRMALEWASAEGPAS